MLKKAQSLQPNNFEVFRGFALVALRRNDFKAADAFGARALKIYEADSDTLLLMAKANMGLLQYTDAQNYVGRALDLDSSNVEALSLNAKITAAIHGVDAGGRYVRERLNQIVMTQGHQIPQEAIDLRITLGEIYMQDERFKPAEDVIRQALTLDPNSKKAFIALAKSLQAQGQPTQALEAFLKAAVMDPSDAEPLFFSGQLYASTGNWAEASKQFERVLRVNPRFPKAHVALGKVALSRGDGRRAIEEAQLERLINPDMPDSYLLSGEAYFNMKQYSNCASEYQKAISKHGQTAITLVKMARCYRLTGALDSAQSLLREATAIESGNPDIYKEQGAIFHTKALADEAIGAYDTYLRLAPNAIDRNEVEARIRKIQAGDMTFTD
jgi:tetratricopeptide (TPR) repeat protein